MERKQNKNVEQDVDFTKNIETTPQLQEL